MILQSLGDITPQKETSDTTVSVNTGDHASAGSIAFQQALTTASQKTNHSNQSTSNQPATDVSSRKIVGEEAVSNQSDQQLNPISKTNVNSSKSGKISPSPTISTNDKRIGLIITAYTMLSDTPKAQISNTTLQGSVDNVVNLSKIANTGKENINSAQTKDPIPVPAFTLQNVVSTPTPLVTPLVTPPGYEVAPTATTTDTNSAQSSAMAAITANALPVKDTLTLPSTLIAQSTSGKSANTPGESGASSATQMPIGKADVPQTTLPFHDIVSTVDTAPKAVGELKTHLPANADMQTQTPTNDIRLMQDTVNPAKGDGGGQTDLSLQIRVSDNMSSHAPVTLMGNTDTHPGAAHPNIKNDAQVSPSPTDQLSGSGQDKQGVALSPAIGETISKAGQGMSEPMAIAQTPLKSISAVHDENAGNASGASSDVTATSAAPPPSTSGSKTDMNQSGSGNEGNHGEQNNTNNSLSATGIVINSVKSNQTSTTSASSPTQSLTDRIQVVDQTMRHLETMQITQGRQELTLQLKPDHLGDVQITIVSDHHQLDTQILASTQHAYDALNDNRNQLSAVLENRGYTLQGLDVAMQNSSQQRNFESMYQQLNTGRVNSIGQSNSETVVNATNSIYHPIMRLSRDYLDYSA